MMYAVAELMANRLPSPEAYIGAVPAVAIVPWFLAGTLYPITALPHWLTYVARALPLTHALALLRYGLTSDGAAALYNIWGMRSPAEMAALSLAVICGYAVVATVAAMRIAARRAFSNQETGRMTAQAEAGQKWGVLPMLGAASVSYLPTEADHRVDQGS